MAYFMAGVANAEIFKGNDLFATAKTLTDSSITIGVTGEDVKAGQGAMLYGKYFHSATMGLKMTDAMFRLEYIAANVGSEIELGGDVFCEEEIEIPYSPLADSIELAKIAVPFSSASNKIYAYIKKAEDTYYTPQEVINNKIILKSDPSKKIGIGKNLLPYPYANTTKTVNGVTYTDNGDGSVTVSGTATEYSDFFFKIMSIAPNTTFTFSKNQSDDAANVAFTLRQLDENRALIGTEISLIPTIATHTFTTAENARYIQIACKRYANAECKGIYKPMLELGDTATDYEPYIEYGLDTKYCIKYLYTNESARKITINANFTPDTLSVYLTAPLFAGDAADPSTGTKVGSVTIKIPRFLLSGSQELTMNMTGASTTAFEGSALAANPEGCEGNAIYAEIIEVIKDRTLDNAIYMIENSADGIEMKNKESIELKLYVGMSDVMPILVDNSKYFWHMDVAVTNQPYFKINEQGIVSANFDNVVDLTNEGYVSVFKSKEDYQGGNPLTTCKINVKF